MLLVQSKMEGHGVGPAGATRVNIAPDEEDLTDCSEFCEDAMITHISGVEDQGRSQLFECGKETRMRPSVGIRDDCDDGVFNPWEVDRSCDTFLRHRRIHPDGGEKNVLYWEHLELEY